MKFIKNLKKNGAGFVKKCMYAVRKYSLAVAAIILVNPMSTYAASASYTQPLINVKNIMLIIVGTAGAIVFVWGGVKLGECFTRNTQGGEYEAVKIMIGGAIWVGIDLIVAAILG